MSIFVLQFPSLPPSSLFAATSCLEEDQVSTAFTALTALAAIEWLFHEYLPFAFSSAKPAAVSVNMKSTILPDIQVVDGVKIPWFLWEVLLVEIYGLALKLG